MQSAGRSWFRKRRTAVPADRPPTTPDHQRLFIPGMPRSGTTWITDWLDERPDVFAVQESYLIQYAIDMLEHQPRLGRMVRPNQARTFLDTVYATAAEGRQWIVDKSPAAFVYSGRTVTDVILEFFPDAYVLCCYRDGKNFVYGHLNLPWPSKVGWTVETATDFWIEQMHWLETAPARQRMKTIRYESLLEAPERSLEIAGFLGMTPHRHIQPWSTPRNTVHRAPDANRWKRLDADCLAVMKRMNPTLEAWGYDPV